MTPPVKDETIRQNIGIAIDGGGIRGIDLRRFQVELPRNIGADGFEELDGLLKEKGAELRERVRLNQHALSDPSGKYDPENLLGIIPLR